MGWHWFRDSQFHEGANGCGGNDAGGMATIRSAAFNLLCLTGFQSLWDGIQLMMPHIAALLAMAMRLPEPSPDGSLEYALTADRRAVSASDQRSLDPHKMLRLEGLHPSALNALIRRHLFPGT